MEPNDQPSMKANFAPFVGALVVVLLAIALYVSVSALGRLMTAGVALFLLGASILANLLRRRALDAAHRAARRLAAYRLPAGRTPGEHRPTGHGRTSQLVDRTWRMPTPPAGVRAVRPGPRHVLALP